MVDCEDVTNIRILLYYCQSNLREADVLPLEYVHLELVLGDEAGRVRPHPLRRHVRRRPRVHGVVGQQHGP